MKWKIYSLSREETEYMRKNLKTKTVGYYSCILLALSLFLSIKLQSVFGILGSLLFFIEIFSKESRLNFIKKLDKKILYGMLVFVVTPYIIATINGGIGTRLDMDDYAKFLLFFPLSFFLNTGEKIFNFLKAILTSATISLLITLGIFVKDYNLWKNPQGFVYDRIYFELPTQDFANIMSMILLFLISFICFYKIEDKNKNLKIKILLSSLAILDIFILLVNRSKMVYICLIPTIMYVLWKKNKKYVISFLVACFGGYFILPKSISDRLKYIVQYKKDPSSHLRVIFWDGAIKMIQKSPILGMQSKQRWNLTREYYKQKGVYEYVIQFYPNFERMRNGLDTHNMYLQYFAYFGIGFLSLTVFFFIIIPSRLMKMSFYKTKINDSKFSKYVAFEIALKASYFCYLIQGITEINLNNQSMIIAFTMLVCMINYMVKDKEFILENKIEKQ